MVIEFETEDTGINPLMGWETNSNTLSELNLEFSTKELAIEYAKKIKLILKLLNLKKEKLLKNLMQIIFLNKLCLNFLLKKNGNYGLG